MNWNRVTNVLCLSILLNGCSESSPSWKQRDTRLQEMRHFALAYHAYRDETGKSPSKIDDLQGRSAEFPAVFKDIQNGRIIVVWNAIFSPTWEENHKYVLIYEKQLPQERGLVVLADGAGANLSAAELQERPLIRTQDTDDGQDERQKDKK